MINAPAAHNQLSSTKYTSTLTGTASTMAVIAANCRGVIFLVENILRRYKVEGTRYKAQGARHKVQGTRLTKLEALCYL